MFCKHCFCFKWFKLTANSMTLYIDVKNKLVVVAMTDTNPVRDQLATMQQALHY